MRLLVTGGAGFIGSNFVVRALSSLKGAEITVLDALTYAGSLDNLSQVIDQITFVHGSICDEGLVDDLVALSDIVVNFAAESHNDNSLLAPTKFFETNVMGTLNLAQACVKHDVRLHHISTDEVFGDFELDSQDEFTIETPYNPSSPYSASKASSDLIVRAWVRSFGLKATISNCSNNYGPNQHWEKLIPATIKRIHSGKPAVVFARGANIRDWIHVDDHVDGILLAIEKGTSGDTYLFGARNRLTNLQVVSAILEAMGKPLSFIDFVQDRPGHDLRYAIDPSNAETSLGWRPNHPDLLQEVSELAQHYVARLDKENSNLVSGTSRPREID